MAACCHQATRRSGTRRPVWSDRDAEPVVQERSDPLASARMRIAVPADRPPGGRRVAAAPDTAAPRAPRGGGARAAAARDAVPPRARAGHHVVGASGGGGGARLPDDAYRE